MKTIYKYPLRVVEEQIITVYEDATFLSVQEQRNEVFLWAEVDTDNSFEERKIFIYGTGHPQTKNDLTYLGTVQQSLFQLVWHVYLEDLSESQYEKIFKNKLNEEIKNVVHKTRRSIS